MGSKLKEVQGKFEKIHNDLNELIKIFFEATNLEMSTFQHFSTPSKWATINV